MFNLYEDLGLATHLFVFVLGFGAMIGIVPLKRGRRAGYGLMLMALVMSIMILEPRWQLGAWGAMAYVVGFVIALWLLLGPERSS